MRDNFTLDDEAGIDELNDPKDDGSGSPLEENFDDPEEDGQGAREADDEENYLE